jgi:hypothetical protein
MHQPEISARIGDPGATPFSNAPVRQVLRAHATAPLIELTWRALTWTVATSVMIGALLWPALWNRFPIVFDDSGGYLARPFEGTLMFGRSAFYGAFLALGTRLDFWPNILAQAALVAWLITLLLRTHGCGHRPWLAATTVCVLSATTSLAWFTSQLMPDVLVPASALSLYLLTFRRSRIGRVEAAGLVALIVAAMASHMSTLALSLALLTVLALVRPLASNLRLPRPHFGAVALAVALGTLIALLSNLAIAGRFAFTPGGVHFVFGRLVQSGIVARYLSEHCPDPTIRLCAFREEVPTTGDDWLWDDASPLVQLGGTDAFGPEARRIVVQSLLLYPGLYLSSAVTDTAMQFCDIGTGYAMDPAHGYTEWAFERFAPASLAALREARQQTTDLDLEWISTIHVPTAAASIMALPLFVARAARRRAGIVPAAAALSLTMLAALCLNAAICASFAVPEDRYQNRMAPLAPLAAAAALLGRRRTRPHADAAGRSGPNRIDNSGQ